MNKRNIPCKVETYSETPNSNLMKVTLRVMSDGENHNGSAFSLSSMIDAEPTIKNTPILAYLVTDEDGNVVDFDGHNMETKLVEGEDGYELKTTYLEQPIGVISESCNPRYENINGKNYFLVDGWLWKSYSNGACKLIEHEDEFSVSMEIRVNEGTYSSEDNVYQINKYNYEGVTILGKNVPPAIEGSRIMKYSSSEVDNKAVLESIYKEIYKIEESEVKCVEEVENVVTEEFEVSKKALADDESVIVKTEPPVTEPEPEPEISETPENEGEGIEVTDEFAEKKKEDEEEVEEEVKKKEDEEDEEEYKKKRKCSMEEFSLECFNVFFEEVPSTLDEVCSALVEKFNAINEELNTLREFKQNYDNAVLVEEVVSIINEFAFEEVEISELKEKAINKEISTKEFKKELFALEGMKVHESKKNFSAEKEEKTSVKINVASETTSNEPYGGLFAKYGK